MSDDVASVIYETTAKDYGRIFEPDFQFICIRVFFSSMINLPLFPTTLQLSLSLSPFVLLHFHLRTFATETLAREKDTFYSLRLLQFSEYCSLLLHLLFLLHTCTQQSEQQTTTHAVKSGRCHEQITLCYSEEQSPEKRERERKARGPEWAEWCRDAFIVASFPLSCVRLSESQSLVLICRTFTPFSCCLAALIKVKPFLLSPLVSLFSPLTAQWARCFLKCVSKRRKEWAWRVNASL